MSPYSEFLDSTAYDVLLWTVGFLVFVGIPLMVFWLIKTFLDWLQPAIARAPAKIEQIMVAAAKAADEVTVQFKSNTGKLAGHRATAWDPPAEYLLENDSEDMEDVEYI